MRGCIRDGIFSVWNGCWDGSASSNAKVCARNSRTCAGLRIESAYLVEYLLPSKSVSALHLYFPDPWPKRKHRKNRLINPRFTEIAHSALAKNGLVYLRTDDEDYFAQMVTVFAANHGFRLAETPEKLSAVVTDFERNFHARGVKTLQAAYAKVG